MKLNKSKNFNTKESEVLKTIMSGAYCNQYLIYNRKSTDEPENQKNSIKYQQSENTRFAIKEQLSIASFTIPGFCSSGIISEKHSGFKEDSVLTFGKGSTVQYRIERPKFYQLVQFLNKKYFKGVIILSWDRVSRNKGDNAIIEKLMKQGLDFRFALASYDKTSSGALHKDIDGMFAIHHSRVTSEKVSLTIKNKREQGICTYKAPVGYLNIGVMENKPIDPVRAPIIIKMFELYATGEWSLADIARYSIEQGFNMSPARRRKTSEEKLSEEENDTVCKIEAICRPPSFAQIQKILTSPFYTGKTIGNDGVYIQSTSHKPLITQELFDLVQKLLQKKRVSIHYTQKLNHPFRGVIRCAKCNRAYTPYPKKGILYFGCRCIQGCENTNRSINLAFVTDNVGMYIQNLSFTEDELHDLKMYEDSESITLKEQDLQSKLENNERKTKKLKEDLAYLQANKLTLLKAGVYTPESMVAEEQSLNQQIYKLEEVNGNSNESLLELSQDIIILSELLKSLYFYYEKANPHQKEKIIKVIFSELNVSENVLKYQCRNGFKALESRFASVCAQKTWLSEIVNSNNLIKESIQDMHSVISSITANPP